MATVRTGRDPASTELLGGAPRRWPIAVAGIAALLCASGIIAVGVSLADRYAGGDGTGPVTAPAEVTEPELSSLTADASSTVLVLPQPTGYDGAVPLGYPRSRPGAIAAAYGYSRISTGLDVAATLDTVEALADPQAGWFPRQRDTLADGLVEQRRGLGLPPIGPTQSASLTITPSGHQIVGDPTANAVTVLTLNLLSATGADGTRTSGVVVLRWDLRWGGERWLATRMYSDERDDKLALTPLTSAAKAMGWQVARGG
ncbi:MAG: hypothetical protein ACT4P1_13035 [Sporichthyaceae bacterium]